MKSAVKMNQNVKYNTVKYCQILLFQHLSKALKPNNDLHSSYPCLDKWDFMRKLRTRASLANNRGVYVLMRIIMIVARMRKKVLHPLRRH